jgi:FkbM family methyltransferase
MNYESFTLFYSRGMAIVARVRQEGVFERALCEKIVTQLSRESSPVFLDVGANIGLISLYVRRHTPKTQVHAFEPAPHQANLLRKTIQENSLEQHIHLHEVALGDKEGKQTFFIHSSFDAAKDGFKDTGRAGEVTEVIVEGTTLDAWWNGVGKPQISIIKIDTEGAELLVLQGGGECLRTTSPTLFLEIESRNLAAYALSPYAILAWCEEHNYTLSTLSGTECTKETLDECMKEGDSFIARPITHPSLAGKERLQQ